MCDYCKNIYTKNNYNPIVEDKINLGIAGKLMVDAVLMKNYKDKPCLYICSCMNTCDGTTEKYKRINYCPMCGKEL